MNGNDMEQRLDAPDPGYFEFDNIAEKLPGLYHRFALSTVGAVEALLGLFDLKGSTILDIGAGTGRSSTTLAQDARRVVAVELQPGVVAFATELLSRHGPRNVSYVRGDSGQLPIRDNAVDHALTAWSVIDHEEARRVTRPGGYVFQIGAGPANMCGELTGVLAAAYSIPRPADPPPWDFWYGNPESPWESGDEVTGYHDVDYVADYGSTDEAGKIWGRIYGPAAEAYLRDNGKSAVRYRLRISHYRVD